jgi:N12 class adenine-specific DNA methylase/predicted RNA methylase
MRRNRAHMAQGQLDLFEAVSPPAEVSEKTRIAEAIAPLVFGGFTYTREDIERADWGGVEHLACATKLSATLTHEEKLKLAAFPGWGAMSRLLNGKDYRHFEQKRKLEQVLTTAFSQEALRSAATASLDAYLTPASIIEAIWGTLRTRGFRGGRVLEPCAGVGGFIGQCPVDLRANSRFWAVEKDLVSAAILRTLYGDTETVIEGGFEDQLLPESFFDLVIGNVPFGAQVLSDRERGGYRAVIHDFFILKSLRKLRPGGLAVLLTSSGTLDKASASTRSKMSEMADLIHALRLPNCVFKAFGAEVTVDVLFFKKRHAHVDPDEGWQRATVKDGATVSHYFMDNPAHVLGELIVEENRFGELRSVCEGPMPSVATLRGAMDRVPYQFGQVTAGRKAYATAGEDMSEGSYQRLEGGVLAVVLDGLLMACEDQRNAQQTARILSMIGVRDAVKTLLTQQSRGDDPSVIDASRASLNAVYDRHVVAHGPITSPKNRQAMDDDPSFPLLLSLEVWDEEHERFDKAPIFVRRTTFPVSAVEKVETLDDAILVSLSEHAAIHVERIATLLGWSQDQARDALLGMPGVFENPLTRHLETADSYLSGNVKRKLAEATTAATEEPRFTKNVAALNEVLPPDIPAADIRVRIGQGWIPERVYEQWVAEITGVKGGVSVQYFAATGTWTVQAIYQSVRHYKAFATADKDFVELFTAALNQSNPTVTRYDVALEKRIVDHEASLAAQTTVTEMHEAFAQWLWADAARTEPLARRYNDTYNCVVAQKYDGRHLTFPGMSNIYTPRNNQRNAVWRALQSWNTLFDHFVGAGKTLILASLAMELRRIGFANKPLIVVANRTLPAFTAEFMRIYPSAKVLMMGRDDMTREQRKRFVARVATSDWDAVIMAQSVFDRIGVKQETLNDYADEVSAAMIDDAYSMEQNGNDRRAMIQSAQQAANKIKSLHNAAEKDDHVLFEDLGVDYLLVDEAHAYKNLFVQTKMTRVAGVATSASQRAINMLLKVRQIYKRRGGTKGVVFATATPLTNTITEVFVLMKYLAPDVLNEFGLSSFDAWAAQFGKVVAEVEVAPDGSGFRMKERFAHFQNVPELSKMCAKFWDAVFPEDVAGLQRPELESGKPIAVTASPSVEQKAFICGLASRAEDVRKRLVKPHEDNMLAIVSDGAKCAIDMRLIDPTSEDFEGSKLNACVRNVFEIWAKTLDTRATQIVFCDIGVHERAGFSVYSDIVRKLIDRGIPPQEIAVAQDFSTDAQIAALDRSFNAGRIRVLLGSTAVLGIGRNVQKRLLAWHHLDVPYRADEVEQRDGRGIRHGNTHRVVSCYRYVTEGSFDAYKWQTVERKARFTAQFRRNGATERVMDDLDGNLLSYAEVKALASGNPAVREIVALQSKERTLLAKTRDDRRKHFDLLAQVKSLPAEIEMVAKQAMEAAEAAHLGVPASQAFVVLGRPKTCDAAIELLANYAEHLTTSRDGKSVELAQWGHLKIIAKAHGQGFRLEYKSIAAETSATKPERLYEYLANCTQQFAQQEEAYIRRGAFLKEKLEFATREHDSLSLDRTAIEALASVQARLQELEKEAAELAV